MTTTWFNEALAIVRRSLKARGFSAKGSTFRRTVEDGNVVLVNVQKSMFSTASAAKATINVGVRSARIKARRKERPPLYGESVWSAHWHTRGAGDKWFKLAAANTPEKNARLMLRAIDPLLAVLMRHATDEALRDEWMAGRSPGVTDVGRLYQLAILVDELGPRERLAEVVAELKGLMSGDEALVDKELARCGVRVPRAGRPARPRRRRVAPVGGGGSGGGRRSRRLRRPGG